VQMIALLRIALWLPSLPCCTVNTILQTYPLMFPRTRYFRFKMNMVVVYSHGHTHRAPLVEIRHARFTRRQRQYVSDILTKSMKHSAYGTVIMYNHKQGHYRDRRICKMMTFNEIRYHPATSTFFQ
jgi:hypothetical protein